MSVPRSRKAHISASHGRRLGAEELANDADDQDWGKKNKIGHVELSISRFKITALHLFFYKIKICLF